MLVTLKNQREKEKRFEDPQDTSSRDVKVK